MKVLPPLIVGEVLLDEYPDGQSVLGGAPFNVAWNLQGLGLAPSFVSAVGSDPAGADIRSQMEAWGMSTDGLQVSAKWPTGRVLVHLKDHEASYTILDHQAYDDIHIPPFPVSPTTHSMLYVGTLASRHERTRQTIRHLCLESGLPRMVDVNIRPPWFDRQLADVLLQGAHWIKLNDQELSFLSEMPCTSAEQIQAAVTKLGRRYGGQRYFITCGDEGAHIVDTGGLIWSAPAPQPRPFVDAVGAGDAFSAAAILGICHGLSTEQLLERSVEFSARACTIMGATTREIDHYTFIPRRNEHHDVTVERGH